MLSILFFSVAWAVCLARASPDEYYSYSLAVGRGSGTPYLSSGDGGITGVKVWEHQNAYIAGIQVRNGTTWGRVFGRKTSLGETLELYEGEAITQVSGKYHPSNYIYQLIFGTSRGRFLKLGQPQQISFNFYPTHAEAELKLLSGRHDTNGITSLGAHWGMSSTDDTTQGAYKKVTKTKA